MSNTIRRYQVFISSTERDLTEAREAVTWQALEVSFIPVGMENFSATDDRGWKTIKRTIDLSDYYVVIVGARYGSLVPGLEISWTEQEYDYARERGLKVLAFLQDMETIKATDVDEDRRKVMAFRERLRENHLVAMFTDLGDLRAKVASALMKARDEDEADGAQPPGWFRGPAPDVTEFARLSAENRELREKLAAVSVRSGGQHDGIEMLKKLPAHAVVVVQTPDSAMAGRHTFEGIDPEKNVVKLFAEGQSSRPRHMALSMINTLYELPDGAWRIVLR